MKNKLSWLPVLLVLLIAMGFTVNYLGKDMYWGDEIDNLREIGVAPYPDQNILQVIVNVAKN